VIKVTKGTVDEGGFPCPLYGVQIMAGEEGFEPPNARTRT